MRRIDCEKYTSLLEGLKKYINTFNNLLKWSNLILSVYYLFIFILMFYNLPINYTTYGNKKAFIHSESADIPGIGQYDDFHTIDWQRDIARDRMRHRYIVKRKQDSLWNLIEGAHDAWSGWLCVLIVGLFTGAVAGVIDIGASWMTDLKFGICPQAFWLNKEQCCWSFNDFEEGNCPQVQ